ncbi:unnamed protein product [Effrenium voratum]|uniref:Saposin B-type domain-containing protein n=1 Tax=Effrenium voratum TaxID=2562239 RepID=A0AA36HJY4_9DINO|nr:unnamed protein product [Effrenium voratum]
MASCLSVMLWTPSSGKGAGHRRGDEGRSGQRCAICQKLAFEGVQVWRQAKTTKPGSPYHYIGAGSQGKAPEAMVLEVVSKKVCNRNVLAQLPNPKGYALHHPTLHYECEDVLENFGDGLIDALTLGEDIAAFCWDVDICGSSDGRLFDFELEDDDDLEESSSEPSKRKGREDL